MVQKVNFYAKHVIANRPILHVIANRPILHVIANRPNLTVSAQNQTNECLLRNAHTNKL